MLLVYILSVVSIYNYSDGGGSGVIILKMGVKMVVVVMVVVLLRVVWIVGGWVLVWCCLSCVPCYRS